MSENNQNQVFNEEEFLKKVEKAARKGARSFHPFGILFQVLPILLILGAVAFVVIPRINSINDSIKGFTHFEDPVENHDLVVENNGIFGYTAADFQEAILGDASQKKKIEVFQQEISDVGTITNTGFMKWGIFTKNQILTGHGTVVYTVDLSSISSVDIVFDDEEKMITIRIPHAVKEEINIPESKVEIGDTERGLLALGSIKMTAEQHQEVMAEIRAKMEKKLVEENVQETADRFAKLTVWEIYSPIVKGVAKDYSLEVEFK